MERTPPLRDTLAYVLPFALFLGFLAVNPYLPISQWARLGLEFGLFLSISRDPLRHWPRHPMQSVALGALVFVIWVGPDLLIPGYRQLAPFNNPLAGHAIATIAEAQKHSVAFLVSRVLVSVLAVPILEELFWRGYLMRWLIDRDFQSVPLGAYSTGSFWIVAVLFASEHGPYWDVGLLTGLIYNGWMVRTRSLWDCILAHAVTNGCLAAYVIYGDHWQYWL